MPTYSRHKPLAFFLILPHILIALIFFIWPAIEVMCQAFFFSDIFGVERRFASFVNFIDLFRDPAYLKAIMTTGIISTLITFTTLFLGLALALLVQSRRKYQPLFKTLLLWPYAVAPAIAAILWRFLCQPSVGWFTQVLHYFNIDFNYLINPFQAVLIVSLASTWQQFSYNFLFYFVALQGIPKMLIEASILDGASYWKRFRLIIFPLLMPTTFFLIVVNLTYALFDTFSIIDVLTSGGPHNSTTTLIYKIYKDTFWGMDTGSASAQSVFLMIGVIILMLIQFRYLDKKVHYK